MQNKYKIAFITLLALVISTIVYILFLVMTPREDIKTYVESTIDMENPSLTLKLDKEQTNEIINYYLVELQKDSKIKYTFVLDNFAMLTGDIKVFDQTIRLYVYFKPVVLESGNLLLEIESFSMGSLELPKKEILRYISNEYKLPDWVYVDLNEENIIVDLNGFDYEKIKFNASKIDLVSDELEFNIFLPIGN